MKNKRCRRAATYGSSGTLPEFSKLRDLPGIGPKMEQALIKLGIIHPRDLINADPSVMYEKWMVQNGMKERCVLYVFRCAVYCAKTSASKRDPELTKWWNWKD